MGIRMCGTQDVHLSPTGIRMTMKDSSCDIARLWVLGFAVPFLERWSITPPMGWYEVHIEIKGAFVSCL